MRFTHIKDFDDDDVVTRNFAKEYNAEKSLYEVATLAAVSADAGTLEEGFDLGECSVTACASKNSLAVAVRHDLSLFDVGMKATFRFTVDTKETVVGMSWLPKVDILLVVLSDGRFLFVNPSSEMSATYNAVDLEERQLQQCKVTTSMHGSVCLVVLSECTGFMFVVHIPGYADVIDSKQSPERFVDLFHAAASHIVVPCDYLFEKPVFHVPMESYFGLCLPAEDEEPPRIVTCSGDTETLCFDEFEEAAFCDGFVTVKRCGQFLFALMATNKIVVYEEATFMQVARWDLGYKDSVVDFFFADLADDLSNFEDCKVFLTISGKHGSKLDVAKVGSNELLYSVGISNNAFIVPEAGTDVGLVLIEPFPLDKPSVFVHSVVESLPELRLEKLLKTRRFEEAVQFAKSFSLDLQKVYRAVMHDALDKLYSSDDPDDKLYQNVLKSFDAVEDSNEIADLCTNAVSVLERFDWVIGFLKYVEKRAVTDEASLEQIAVLRYNLATYRQIFDPLKPSQDRHMVASWKAFVENEWFDIFQGLCEAGLLHEARLLWQRHREIAECMKDLECCNKILGAFGVTIDKDLNAVQAAVELLEGEMIPLALLNQDDEMCDQMIEWIIGIAEHLERVLPDEFPDNSLWVSRAMERAIDSTISNSVTPLDQSRLMYTLSKIRSDAQDVRMGRLNAYAHSLAVMAKLKAVYGLKMSHQTYRDQNVQTICYLILERIKAAEKIREQVSRFAIPYMDEYKLNKDETLYEYINTVTGENVFTATSSGNPWDERCLEISKAIGNTHVRCRAIIDIARRSCPPWTTSLTAAVNSMLQIPTLDKELIKELHRQCQQAEFGQILLRYEIPLSVLDSSIQYSRSFAAIIKKVCHPREDVEQQIAVADALELVALHKKLAPTATEVKPEAVYTFFAEAVVAEEVLRWLEADKKAEMDHAQLIAFMDVVPAELRHAVAAQLAEKHFIRLEAYPASKKSSGEKKRRLALISTNLCLLQRYYQCADKTRLIDVLGAIRSLQLHFNNYVGPSFFESEERYAFFTATLSRMTEWSWPQVVNVATALLLDQGEACRFAMDTAVRQQVSPVLTLTMVREYTSIHTEVTDSFLETSVKCIDYALSRFSSMAAEQRQGTAANGSVVDCVELLHEILPTLLNSIEASAIFYKDSRTHPWFVKISRVSRYIEIFMQFLEQSFYGENADRMEVDDQPDASVNESEIYGIQSRVGVYSFRRDGAIYDRDEGIPLLASVATAMLDGELQQAEGDQRINWRQLFEFFTGYQQSILEITSCCLAASVTQNSEASWAYVADCYQSICNACTKILAVPKNADLWLATAIIELLAPEEAGKISMELRKWAVQKKNPRITVNALRVFQRKTIMTEDNKLWIQYSRLYAVTTWTKRMSKYNGKIPSPEHCQNIGHCVREFVSCLLPPAVIVDYCRDFDIDLDETLIQFAFTLCMKCGSEEPQLQRKIIDLADAALLEMTTTTANGFKRMYNTLLILCPYQFEVIQVLLRHLKRFAVDDVQKKILFELEVIMDYLFNYKRLNESTQDEVKWYQDRQKIITSIESFEGQDVDLYDTKDVHPDESNETSDYYENQEIVAKKLPTISERRLPFHVFLLKTEAEKMCIMKPIVDKEITITSVQGWIELISRLTEHVRLSRTSLMAKAVENRVKAAENSSTELEPHDIKRIHQLLYQSRNRGLIGKVLYNLYSKLQLSVLKRTVMEVGLEVLLDWQRTGTEDDELHKLINRLRQHIKTCSTSYILQEKQLLDQTTQELNNKPKELIVYIYAHMVDWNDCDDIQNKLDIARNIAEVHQVDIHDIHIDIIKKWIAEDEKVHSSMDPDATMEDIAPTMEPNSENVLGPIPYNDTLVTRIVCLMRLCEGEKKEQLLSQIGGTFNMDPSQIPNGIQTLVRLKCCLYRWFATDAEFVRVFTVGLDKVSERTTLLLYNRLIHICRLDLGVASFAKMDKAVFVRGLLPTAARQNMDLYHFMGSVLVDYQIEDAALISQVAQRLLAKPKSLYNLLKYCKKVEGSAVRNGKSLAVQWIRVFEAMFAEVRDRPCELRGILCFLLSCPMELGQQLAGARQILHSSRLFSTEVLASIAACPTCIIDDSRLRALGDSQDLPMRWMRQ